MKFAPKNFRRISDGSRPEFKIRGARGMPLILIKETGEAMFANTDSGKDDLVAQFDGDTDLLLWAWIGRWRTDIFQLTPSDVSEYYK